MTTWRDQRFRDAEAKSIAADRAERENQPDLAMTCHHEAAQGFADLAADVPAGHPNTRSDLAISAMASFERAGRRDRAVQFGRRMLAERDLLSPRGRGELSRMIAMYDPIAPRSVATSAPVGDGDDGRSGRIIAGIARLSREVDPAQGWQERVLQASAADAMRTEGELPLADGSDPDPAASALDVLADIMLEMQRRRMLAAWTATIRSDKERKILESDPLDDDRIGDLAARAFDSLATDLIERGHPDTQRIWRDDERVRDRQDEETKP